MANLLQSTQVKSTCAPGFYTDYLSNLASRGQAAQQAAQYVGAQPLQQKAFEAACASQGQFQPALATGQQYVGQAAGQNITGAATPYLQAATTASPLCAARPMICQAANLNIACLAGQYMSPYLQKAMQSVSDIGQRNIRQNLSPMATAAAVGSGQFGSQRGAQVLGQVQEQAQQDINKQMAEMANAGYGQALQAAQAKQAALGQAAGQISAAQQAQNQANLQAAQTAGGLTAQQAQALQQAGLGMGTLGQTAQSMNLACINALSTLGGQQQTIAQNQQNYPLTTLASLASLLQGYSIPTATKTQLQMSPFSALGAIGSAGLGLMTPKYDAAGNVIAGSRAIDQIGNIFRGLPTSGSSSAGSSCAGSSMPIGCQTPGSGIFTGCSSSSMPIGCQTSGGGFCSFFQCGCYAEGGSVQRKAVGGHVGCASTKSRGGLPYKKG
jgi:hypothetical protein